MTSFDRSSAPSTQHIPPQEDDTAVQLQRELELFAQDEDDEEDAALIQFDGADRASSRQPQNSSHHDSEIQEYERYFEQE